MIVLTNGYNKFYNENDYTLEDVILLKKVFEDMLHGISQFCVSRVYDPREGSGLCCMIWHVCTGLHFKDDSLEIYNIDIIDKGRALMFDVVKSSRYYSGDYAYFIKGSEDLYSKFEYNSRNYKLSPNKSGFYTGKQLEYRMKTIRRCINRCDRLIKRCSK